MTEKDKTIGDIGELGFLKDLFKTIKHKDKNILVGLGDDAAVISSQPDVNYVFTTDMLVEKTHFDLRYTTFYDLGRKSVIVNVSDIASMGAEPSYILISIGYPKNLLYDFVKEFYDGIKFECDKWGCEIIGGDTVGSDKFIINICMIGKINKKENICLRSSAKERQYVYVTGELGESSAGLQMLMLKADRVKIHALKDKKELFNHLTQRHLLPTPRLEFSRFIKDKVNSLSMIDISDGLFNELNLISEASKVGFEINIDNIFKSDTLTEYCNLMGTDICDINDYLLFGGEDFEMLFITETPPDKMNEIMTGFNQKLPISYIGKTLKHSRGVVFKLNGKKIKLDNKTFKHF